MRFQHYLSNSGGAILYTGEILEEIVSFATSRLRKKLKVLTLYFILFLRNFNIYAEQNFTKNRPYELKVCQFVVISYKNQFLQEKETEPREKYTMVKCDKT